MANRWGEATIVSGERQPPGAEPDPCATLEGAGAAARDLERTGGRCHRGVL